MEKVNAMNEIIDNYNVNTEMEIDNSELEDIMLIEPGMMTIADEEEFFRLLKEAKLFIPIQMEKWLFLPLPCKLNFIHKKRGAQ